MKPTREQEQRWIESALGDQLGESERALFDAHLSASAAFRADWEDAVAARHLLSALPVPSCPDIVVDRVLGQIDEELAALAAERGARVGGKGAWTPPFRGLLGRLKLWFAQPLPALARLALPAAAAAVLLLALLGPQQEPSVPAGFDEAVAQQAADEARLAFAIVARTMDDATTVLQREMRGRVAEPLTGFREYLTDPIQMGLERSFGPAPGAEAFRSHEG